VQEHSEDFTQALSLSASEGLLGLLAEELLAELLGEPVLHWQSLIYTGSASSPLKGIVQMVAAAASVQNHHCDGGVDSRAELEISVSDHDLSQSPTCQPECRKLTT
jgi:hypothetical protein